MKTYILNQLSTNEIDKLYDRSFNTSSAIFRTVKRIIKDVKQSGDSAIQYYTNKFDKIECTSLSVPTSEIENADTLLTPAVKSALDIAFSNIYAFHKVQIPTTLRVETMPGVSCIRQWQPIEKVGLYIPGGTAPLVSTMLMLGIPALLANCKQVIVCTPPLSDGTVSPAILYAAKLCNITQVFKVGGAQAIAGMAYGSETLPKSFKIFGPGNAYVTAAKLLVSQDSIGAAIDLPAGPSEVLIICDEEARNDFVASDLISQAEHGSNSQSILVCLSKEKANAISKEVKRQLDKLPRKQLAKKSLKNSYIVISPTINQAIEFSNYYAPEHLILNVENPELISSMVKNAGSVFLGAYSCESAGDYASGTNHTLPTSGFSRAYSGLSVESFMKQISFQTISKQGIATIGPTVMELAKLEGLMGHKKAMQFRVDAIPLRNVVDDNKSKKLCLLNANERATNPSARVITALSSFITSGQLPRYPDYTKVYQSIANYAQVSINQIVITNGSDNAIERIFKIFLTKTDKIIIPSPSFTMYFQYAKNIGANIISPNIDTEFPLRETLAFIDNDIKLIVICNPNNPTGTLTTVDAIEQIAIKAKNAIVLVDEAYFEFSNYTAVNLINTYSNIIIIRTFSKAFGLASLRIGYLITNPEQCAKISNECGPFEVNSAACIAAEAALSDSENCNQYVNEIMNTAKPLVENFFTANNIYYYPSQANFLLFKPNNATKTFEYLKENGFLLRQFDDELLSSYLRVTIGTVEQMQDFIKAYNNYLRLPLPKKKIAFIDRDGTLIYEPQDTYQIDSLDKLRILNNVIEGLQKLQQDGYELVIVSNQNGIGTLSFPEENFLISHNRMLKIFSDAGIYFKEIFICPHFSSDDCQCRKPKTGLVSKFMRENQEKIDKEKSFVCGDRDTDRQFAENLGLRFINVKTNGSFECVINTLSNVEVCND